MRKLVPVFIAATLLTTLPVQAAPVHRHFRCQRIDWHSRSGATALIRCQVRRLQARYGASVIPGGERKALSVSGCESSNQYWEASGPYGGIYQIGADSDRHGEWRDWEPHTFWRYHPRANPRMRGRFHGFFNVTRALTHVVWIVRHPRLGPWYGRGWGPWSCA